MPIPKKTIVVQIQVCRRNSFQPSRNSARNGSGSTLSSRFGIRTRSIRIAPAPKLAASTSSALPGLPAPTSTPPRAGPSTPRIDRLSPSSAFACCSRTALTTSGINPCEVGITKPSASPKTSASTISIHTVA